MLDHATPAGTILHLGASLQSRLWKSCLLHSCDAHHFSVVLQLHERMFPESLEPAPGSRGVIMHGNGYTLSHGKLPSQAQMLAFPRTLYKMPRSIPSLWLQNAPKGL